MRNVQQSHLVELLACFTLGYWIVSAILRRAGIRGRKAFCASYSGPDGSETALNGDREGPKTAEDFTATTPQPVPVFTPDQTDVPNPADDLAAEIAWLQAENARLKALRGLTLKVSEKGALSVYGLGRFPTTLYREQWEGLLANADAIRQFISEHPELKSRY